ncbi:hypothetical protein F4861DRAFT_134969 [Xylaria intraflava]|nr:hypothetical protein F4861DRAFT_134969 [Xylaria intraflava]
MSYANRVFSHLTAATGLRLLTNSRSSRSFAQNTYHAFILTNDPGVWGLCRNAPSRLRHSMSSLHELRDHGEETARETNKRDQRALEEEAKSNRTRHTGNKATTKGKLLTTPTRLLKLILPLPVKARHTERGNNGGSRAPEQNENTQPLALLVHPQQPLSYLERLIQAELPTVHDSNGHEKIPSIHFLAENSGHDEDGSGKANADSNIALYSGLGHEGAGTPAKHQDWVRWSGSTEIGDFIRDAARGREFAIHVDSLDTKMRVDVPSFNDRTHYMRSRLRRMSHRVEELSRIKQECDMLAHRGAHRLAQAGFGALTGWWATVYYVTFHTDAGWDLVEPVTYLAGLTTIMGGYLWFLFISRDLSYQAALKITVSRRQNVLYQARGFDSRKWEALVDDVNTLRREIRIVAEEYDVEWEEAKDVGERVKAVLEKEIDKRKMHKDAGDQDAAEPDEATQKNSGLEPKTQDKKE